MNDKVIDPIKLISSKNGSCHPKQRSVVAAITVAVFVFVVAAFFSIGLLQLWTCHIFLCFIFKTIIKVSNENVNKRLEWAKSKSCRYDIFFLFFSFALFSHFFLFFSLLPLWRLAASVPSFENVYNIYVRRGKRNLFAHLYVHIHKLQWLSVWKMMMKKKMKRKK